MTDFQTVPGFEDIWRPPIRRRVVRTPAILSPRRPGNDTRARLARVAKRAPEVMVKVTGRTHDAGHLRDHLDYISRNGELEMEDRDGAVIAGRAAVSRSMIPRTSLKSGNGATISPPSRSDQATLRYT